MTIDCNPVIGEPPVMSWTPLSDLSVDPAYQRSLDSKTSQTLIRDIARNWDWRLCQPLAVVRRGDESLWVVDGQHRLTAAAMRSDIPRLPCVITAQDDRSAEAMAFVNLNRRRRALNSVDVFKAQIVAGVPEAIAVEGLIGDARLTIAPHSNFTAWKPGMLFCVPGILSAYRRHGRDVTAAALEALREAFDGVVLRYAGQILRGLFIVYATEGKTPGFDNEQFVDRLSFQSQQQWMRKANERVAMTSGGIARAIADVMIDAYRKSGAR